MAVLGLDHIVLNVSDAKRSLDFYCGKLGLAPMRVDEWESGHAPFPSARIDASTIIDFIQSPPTGNNLDHFCLVVDASDVAEVARRWDPSLVAEGPVSRFGAKGLGTSIYVRDPDGNLVELRHYG